MKPHKRKYKIVQKMIEEGEFPINKEDCNKITVLSVKDYKCGFFGFTVEVQSDRIGKCIVLTYPWSISWKYAKEEY